MKYAPVAAGVGQGDAPLERTQRLAVPIVGERRIEHRRIEQHVAPRLAAQAQAPRRRPDVARTRGPTPPSPSTQRQRVPRCGVAMET